MFEIQGDAGGRRFVAPLATNGVMTSCAAILSVGEKFTATHIVRTETNIAGKRTRTDSEESLTVNTDTLKSFLIHVTQPLAVAIGDQSFNIVPHAPLMWFEEWPMECPIKPSSDPLEITATPTEENTQLTVVLVN